MRLSAWAPLIFGLLCAALVFNTQGWNSDSIVPEFVYRDLTTGVSLSGWHFASDLLFFPDWPIWFLIRSFTSNLDFALFVYEALIFTSLNYFLLVTFGRERGAVAIAISTALWLLIFPAEWRVFVFPAHHGTALVLGLWWAHFYVSREQLNSRIFLGLALVGGLTAASDPLFGIWFLIPAGIYTLGLLITKLTTTREFFVRLSLGLATLLVCVSVQKLFLMITGSQAGLANQHHSLFDSTDSVVAISRYFYGFKIKLLALLLGFVLLCRGPLKSFRSFSAASVVSTIMIVSAMNIWIDSSNARYLLPFAVYICIELTRVILQLKGSRLYLACAVLVGVAISNQAVRFRNESYETVETNRTGVRCIENSLAERGLIGESGVASYWGFKMMLAYETHPLRLRQVDEAIAHYGWLANMAWMESSNSNSKYAVIVPRELQIFSSVFKPTEVKNCGDYFLLIAKSNASLSFEVSNFSGSSERHNVVSANHRHFDTDTFVD